MAVDVQSLRHAHEHGLTVGVISTNGALRTRLEIDEFIKDKDMANLYILALINLQKMDSWRDRFSYFQIAGKRLQDRKDANDFRLTSVGIHGKPFVPWDDVRPDESTTIFNDLEKDFEDRPLHRPNPASGYCSHSSNLFPTWHRKFAQREDLSSGMLLMALGAYLAMLEQTIYLKMVEIAEQYPEQYRRRYLDATAKFGLPYCESAIVTVSFGIQESNT